ncbi:MAG TPA: hypothetical protein PK333_03675 [Candidatus Moranbacteria bacterium]|nr:hypothetical protein [Candidatus Moranbacteria bacterium]
MLHEDHKDMVRSRFTGMNTRTSDCAKPTQYLVVEVKKTIREKI